MIKIFKSPLSKNVYIEGVTFGSSDDFTYQRDGDLFTIDRTNTKIIEVNMSSYEKFSDQNGDTFEDADDFEAYLQQTIESDTILNKKTAPYLDTINGDLIAVYVDTNRSDRILSVETFSITMGENVLGDNDWFIAAGNASDQDSCFIAKRDMLITSAWMNCEDDNNSQKSLNLWVDGSLDSTIFTTLGQNNVYQQQQRDDLLIAVNKGQRIRFRAGTEGGNINDTVMNISGHYEKR